MKGVFLLALVLGFTGLAQARDEKVDPVGTWACDYEVGGQKRSSTLAIQKEADKFTGTTSLSDQWDSMLFVFTNAQEINQNNPPCELVGRGLSGFSPLAFSRRWM
jgi:hypothetical protein